MVGRGVTTVREVEGYYTNPREMFAYKIDNTYL